MKLCTENLQDWNLWNPCPMAGDPRETGTSYLSSEHFLDSSISLLPFCLTRRFFSIWFISIYMYLIINK